MSNRFVTYYDQTNIRYYIDKDSQCEHVEKDKTLAYCVDIEADSFGVVSSHAKCKECHETEKNEVDEELHTCFDCLKEVKRADGIMWKWYDFYAPQGDEPLFICNECKGNSKHTERVAKDNADYNYEMCH